MTNDKTKISNALLGSTKKYSKYRLFDEPTVTKTAEEITKSNLETALVAKIDGAQDPVLGGAPDVIIPSESTSVTVTTKHVTRRSCKNYTIDSLFGLPRAIVLAIYQNCKLTGNNITNEITMDHLVAMIGSNKSCIKTTISRLKTKKLISTEAYKTGRGGWAIYRLSENLYCDISKMEASKRSKMAKKS